MTRVAWSRGLALASCVAVALSRATATADELIVIRGRVVVSLTGRAVFRASVVVRDGAGRELHLLTDRDGRYVAIGLRAGPVDVTVEHEGFAPEAQSCRIRDGETLRLDFDVADRTGDPAPRRFPCRIEPQTADRYVIE